MIKSLISDLGNVMLHFDHRIIAARLAHDFPEAAWTESGKDRFWEMVHDFETGSVSTAEFMHETGLLLGSDQPLDAQRFRTLWGDIFWLNEEYLALLRELRESVSLVMLSNTNPLHIDFARERFPEVFEVFSETVFSYDVGTGKPDKRIFEEALHKAGSRPEETIYFDDISAYVEAASALGMHAHQYVSVQGARDVLAMYDLRVLTT